MKLIDLNFEKYISDTSSYKSFQKLGFPHPKTEEFKKVDLKPIYETEFNFNYTFYTSLEAFEYLKNENFYYIFIVNSLFLSPHSNINSSIKFTTDKKNHHTSSNAFYHLAESFIESKDQININKSLDKPLLIINISNYLNSFVPSSLNISIAKNTSADILELFISNNCTESLFNINRKLILDENSTLNYTTANKFGVDDLVIVNNNAVLKDNTNLNIVTLDYDTKQKLNLWDYDLNNENSKLDISGITNIKENKQNSNIAKIIHEKPNTTSHISFKHILNDAAHAIFDVKTVINEKAYNSKVFQSSKTMLLCDNAKINAQPRLQIYTDELEAKHSATTGAINKEQLYYLQSRGITHKDATEILLESFEEEIYGKIQNPWVKEFVKKFQGKSDD